MEIHIKPKIIKFFLNKGIINLQKYHQLMKYRNSKSTNIYESQ